LAAMNTWEPIVAVAGMVIATVNEPSAAVVGSARTVVLEQGLLPQFQVTVTGSAGPNPRPVALTDAPRGAAAGSSVRVERTRNDTDAKSPGVDPMAPIV